VGTKLAKASVEEGLSRDEASDVRTVAKGGAIQITGQFANKGFTLLLTAIVLRMIGAAGYGLYREVFQILSIATTIAGAGFPYGALRFIARARALKDHGAVRGAARVTLGGTAIWGTAIFFAIFFGAPVLAERFGHSVENERELTFLLRIGAAYIPMYALMQVLRSCTQAYKTMVPAVMVGNIIQPVTRLVFGVAALFLGFAVAGLVTALTLSAAVSAVAGAWYFHRMLTSDERTARPKAEIGPILRFTIPQAGVALFSTSSLGLGIVILGLFRGARAVGLFGVAQALQVVGNVFLTGIVAIFTPVVVDLYERGEKERLQSIYQTINRWVATFSFPIFAALVVVPDLFTRILGGAEGVDAAILVPILAAGNIFYVGTGPSGYLISMTGRPGLNLANSASAVALYVGLGVWLVPTYGMVGMAVVDAFVTAFVNIVRIVEIRILIGIRPWGRTFLKPIVATLAGAGALLAWEAATAATIPMQLLGVVLFGIVYLSLLKLMGIDAEERHIFEAIKAKAFRRSGRRR